MGAVFHQELKKGGGMAEYFKTAGQLHSAIAAGKKTAVEVMQATLDRIAAVNPKVNAIVSLREPEVLLTEAHAADQHPIDQRGPLFGLPIAIKDLANVKGLPTSHGSPIFAGQIAEKDDLMVDRIRAAGAIIIGKTNTPEMGLGSHTFNPVFGATRNPYDVSRSAGGSSGGAATALAAGMLAIADGSDMMGSLRNPAAWNNVYGFRPTWGCVPSEPEGDVFLHQLSTSGPMARSPDDILMLLRVMAGADPRVPNSRAAQNLPKQLHGDLRGKRLGWLGTWGGALPFEPGLLEATQNALDVFRRLGAEVDELAPPFERERLWQSWTTLRSWAIACGDRGLYEKPAMRAQMKPALIWEIERGLALSALDVHRASMVRSKWFAACRALFERYDALLMPSAQVWPFAVEEVHPTQINGTAMDTYHRWMEVVIPAGLIGLPVLNLPAGFGGNGLPLGLQLIGAKGTDAALLSMGQAWHQETNWPSQKPPRLD